MAATYQMTKKHKERPGDERWQKKTNRYKHMNPTDNEDEETKGKEREIKRLDNWSARAEVFLLCSVGLGFPTGSLQKMQNGTGLVAA